MTIATLTPAHNLLFRWSSRTARASAPSVSRPLAHGAETQAERESSRRSRHGSSAGSGPGSTSGKEGDADTEKSSRLSPMNNAVTADIGVSTSARRLGG